MNMPLTASTSVRPEEITEAMHWRYATRVFDKERKVPEEDVRLLTEVLRLSPSSIGLQPWKFILVKDPQLRQRLRNSSLGQAQITDASHLFVLCSLNEMSTSYVDRMIAFEKETLGYPDTMLAAFRPHAIAYIEAMSREQLKEWMAEQTYIALGFLLSACAMLRIDACPMEAFDRGQADKLLQLDKYGVGSRTLVAIGYRSAGDRHAQDKKVRFPIEEVFITI